MKSPNLHLTKIRVAGIAFLLTLASQALVPFLVPSASAGTLTQTMVRFDRLAQSQATTGTVCAAASASGAGTEAFIQVTFPTGFTVSTTTSDWATNTTSSGYAWPTGATAMPTPGGAGSVGSSTANSASGQNVTWKISDLTDTTLHCFNWTSSAAVSTGTAGSYTGVVTTQNSTPATIDTGNYATTTVSSPAPGDQVTVTATVNPTFSMSLSAASDGLGTLTTGSVSTSGTPITVTVSTNAANGWYMWGKDGNSPSGLHSTTASYTIQTNCSGTTGSSSTLSAGTEGFNLGARINTQGSGSGGTTSLSAVFDDSSTAGKGGGLCSGAGGLGYQTIASSNGTANAAKVDLRNNAAISGVTKPATDYQDVETFVGAGLF